MALGQAVLGGPKSKSSIEKVDMPKWKTIQERLRHANFATTANIYTHVTRKISREAANQFDALNPSQITEKLFVPNPSPNT
jgi:hypothetical protein